MSASAVLSHVAGGVLTLTLNRPDQINAVNDAIRTGLPEAVAAGEADPEVRVIVLIGAGERGFCAGADIAEARAPETPVEARARMTATPWIERVAAARKPVIAAIHGYCLGAGLELAMTADIRLATADAKFGLPETGLGLIPGGGGTQRLPRLLGEARALDMILTGERIDAETAHRLGLVTRLVPEGETLVQAAATLAARLAARPPAAMRHAKEAVRAAAGLPLDAGLRLETGLFALLLDTEDRREAAAAFREKRAPNFTGR
jgi:enoyl-CoA hydratase/carnithine racemase